MDHCETVPKIMGVHLPQNTVPVKLYFNFTEVSSRINILYEDAFDNVIKLCPL